MFEKRRALKTVWKGMIKRCRKNPNDYRCRYYGMRGITVCSEWKENFDSFYSWAIDNGYEQGLTIDRIDNDGNYCPENCRWATIKQQDNNRRSNHKLTINGVSKNVSEWAEEYGILDITVLARLRHGWSEEDAVTKPVRPAVRKIRANGEEHTIKEWAKITGLSAGRISHRLCDGWSEEDAVLTKPIKNGGVKNAR